MKKLFVLISFFVTVIFMPNNVKAQVGVVDAAAIAQSKANTKNSENQKDAVEDLKKTFEKTTELIGTGGLGSFSNAKQSIVENLEKRMKVLGTNPISSGPYSKWDLNGSDYDYLDRDSGKIENAMTSFITREELGKTSNLKSNMEKIEEYKDNGRTLLINTVVNTHGNAVGSRGEYEAREQVLKDIESATENSESVRDDMVGNTLFLLATAHYYQQILNLYANKVELSVASIVNSAD